MTTTFRKYIITGAICLMMNNNQGAVSHVISETAPSLAFAGELSGTQNDTAEKCAAAKLSVPQLKRQRVYYFIFDTVYG